MYGKKSKTKIFGKGVFFLVMAAIFVFVLGCVVMMLWNALLPEIIGAKPITFWQGVGLFILSRILFGGFSRGRSKRHRDWKERKKKFWKEKMDGMEVGEKQRMKEKWEAYCNRNKKE